MILLNPRGKLTIIASGTDFILASSIHTIHRPVAHSRLATPAFGRDLELPSHPQLEAAEDYFSNPLSTDEDDGLRDFDEAATPEAPDGVPNPFKEPARMRLQLPAEKSEKAEGKKRMPPPTRTASMATVRMKRRTKLADKLRDVFGIPEIQEVVAGKWADWRVQLELTFVSANQRCRVGCCALSVSDFSSGMGGGD